MKPYLDIMNHFGIRNQMKKLNEECYEFIEAVDNYEDFKTFYSDMPSEELVARSFVIEECADILLLLTQFIALYDIEKKEIDTFIDEKLKRTLDRIETGYYDKF